jgi:LPXTG-motif cell wall-anchored protein
MRNSLCTFFLAACIAWVSLPVSAQESDPVATWLTLVNEARLDEGLAPYGLSTLLNASAQRHADDLAAHGFTSDDVHVGSDGSTIKKRITETGYTAWTRNGGELIVNENVWTGEIEDGLAAFLEDPPQRENILNPVYREIGIGVAADENGQNYYVLTFGARPNVLPIFINDGAANTDNAEIAIRLTNEEFRPEGQGVVFMGQAIEIRINNEPVFEGLPWQTWEPLVPWTLPNSPGEHTVYVQFRDAANRTAASTDSIVLGEGAVTLPTATLPSPTAEATATITPTIAPTVAPAVTSTASATPTPPTPTSSPLTPSPSPPPLNLTPFPTWTPLPLPSPPETGDHSMPLGAVVTLQGLAIILGLYLALRRRNSRDDA